MKFYYFLFLFLYGCKSISPEVPIAVKAVAPPPKIIVSNITIPVGINLQEGLNEVEKQVPLKFQGSDQPCEGLGYSYIFERKPISFEFKENALLFSVAGGLGLDVNYCPSCHSLFGDERCVIPRVYGSCGSNGEPRRQLLTQFQSNIQLNKNYQLVADTKLKSVKLLDPCQFSFMKINVTKEIENTITTELIKQEKEINQQISSLSIRPQLITAWDKLQDPIPLNGFGFLYLQPKSVAFDKVIFIEKQASTNIHLTLSPTVLNTKSTTYKKTALPSATEQKPAGSFGLYVDVVANYDSLNALLTASLKGSPIEIERKKFIVDSASLFQVSLDTLGLKVVFSGFKEGILYFKGVPKIDSVSQKLKIESLSYTLSTKSVLLNSAKWLYSDKILSFVQNNSSFELGPYMKKIEQSITENLNQEIYEGIKLSGKLTDLALKNIYIQEKNILVRCLMNAEMKLKIY
ncbi:MAG: DUF4403 family protein [Crocinitomicaceae bacterium]